MLSGYKWCHLLPKGLCGGYLWQQLSEGVDKARCADDWRPQAASHAW